jgi:hypothetical protein
MIYEIVCNITNEKYYGSTKLQNRLQFHKAISNKCNSKQIIDRGNYIFRIIETLDNPTKIELLTKEKEYIKNNECINKYSPIRTIEELRAYEKKKNDEKYLLNKEDILKKNKEYYDNNKEKILTQQKKYYEDNRVLIKEIRKEKILCVCGEEYTIQNKARHCKSKKHINFIK